MNISVTSLGLNTTSKTKNYKINFKKISTNQLGIFKDNCANNHNNFAYSFDAGFDLVVNLAKSLKSVLDKIPKDYSLQDKLNALLYKEISEYSLYDSGNSFYIKDGQICSYRNSNGDDILYTFKSPVGLNKLYKSQIHDLIRNVELKNKSVLSKIDNLRLKGFNGVLNSNEISMYIDDPKTPYVLEKDLEGKNILLQSNKFSENGELQSSKNLLSNGMVKKVEYIPSTVLKTFVEFDDTSGNIIKRSYLENVCSEDMIKDGDFWRVKI